MGSAPVTSHEVPGRFCAAVRLLFSLAAAYVLFVFRAAVVAVQARSGLISVPAVWLFPGLLSFRLVKKRS